MKLLKRGLARMLQDFTSRKKWLNDQYDLGEDKEPDCVAEQREIATKLLSEIADPEQHFFIADGNTAKNLMDLFFLVQDMSQEHFSCHVNEDKNDFSAWIENCIGDKQLAQEVACLKDRDELALVIGYRIKELLAKSR